MSLPTKPGHCLVLLPFFPGFYESVLSQAIDIHEEREAEYMADREVPYPRPEPRDLVLKEYEEPEHEWKPEHLRISASEYEGLFFDCCDYQATYLNVAQLWVEAFDWWCKENIGTPEKSFTWEAMVSPREYNFTTDRVFSWVTDAVMNSLIRWSAREGHDSLDECIRGTFTSYDGFISFYSNDANTWLEKSIDEWDHNELGTLLAARMTASDGFESRADFSMELYYSILSGNREEDKAWAMDWPKFEKKVAELRAKKLEDHEAQLTTKGK